MMFTLLVPFISQPCFARLAHAVVTEAEEPGYDVLIDETSGVPERELRVASGLGAVLSDGILFSPLCLGLDQIVAAGSSTPLVLLGERLLGFNQALAEVGLEAKPEHILGIEHWDITGPEGLYTREAGHSRIVELLRSPQGLDGMDALTCANAQLAVGALRALHEAGIEVPNQVAVVGWDDIPEAAFTAPGLTTVSPRDESHCSFGHRADVTSLWGQTRRTTHCDCALPVKGQEIGIAGVMPDRPLPAFTGLTRIS